MDRPKRKHRRHRPVAATAASGEEEPRARKRSRGSAAASRRSKKAEESSPVESEKDKQLRERALAKLREAADLPTSYAALKLVKDRLPAGIKLSRQDEKLFAQACLAVPFLMHKQCIELFTRPRSFQGLAFSIAKAKMIAGKLFESIGPACCSVTVTEEELVSSCGIDKVDAHKVIPKLKEIGQEARAQVESVRKELETEESPISVKT